MKTECPHCGQHYEVDKEYIDQIVECTSCGQEFVVEYGCYGNYTKAVIKDIRPTDYEQIKIVDYTIPNYTGEEIHTDKMVWVEVREN